MNLAPLMAELISGSRALSDQVRAAALETAGPYGYTEERLRELVKLPFFKSVVRLAGLDEPTTHPVLIRVHAEEVNSLIEGVAEDDEPADGLWIELVRLSDDSGLLYPNDKGRPFIGLLIPVAEGELTRLIPLRLELDSAHLASEEEEAAPDEGDPPDYLVVDAGRCLYVATGPYGKRTIECRRLNGCGHDCERNSSRSRDVPVFTWQCRCRQ